MSIHTKANLFKCLINQHFANFYLHIVAFHRRIIDASQEVIDSNIQYYSFFVLENNIVLHTLTHEKLKFRLNAVKIYTESKTGIVL